MTAMDAPTNLADEVEALIVYAESDSRDDRILIDRIDETAQRDPGGVLDIGERLVNSHDPERRRIAIRLISVAGAAQDRFHRDRALRTLRRVLGDEAEPVTLATAIVEIGHLDDSESHDAVLGHARHPDPRVRHAVAFSLPSVGFDAAAIATVRDLMVDEDDGVRDWATFDLGTLSDVDNEEIRDALLARLDDHNLDPRLEAIVGLARRQDERIRPYLEAELARVGHSSMYDDALDYLDNGTDVPEAGWTSSG
jgi:hypothetical protein